MPSGFSVYAGPRVHPTDPEHLERLARYIVRVPMPQKDVRLTHEGRVRVAIPGGSRTGTVTHRISRAPSSPHHLRGALSECTHDPKMAAGRT